MPSRRDFIKTVASASAFTPLVEDVFPKNSARAMAGNGLHSFALQKNMFFGAAMSEDIIIADAAYRTAIANECGILVPEFEMKWDKMRPTSTTYNFSDSDFIVNFASQNGLAVRGHTFCWHRALPSWFSSTLNRTNAARFLTEHIAAVAGRYKGRMHSWDVVNEAVEPSDRQTNNLRNNIWFQLLGESYIETAFRATAQADPKAMLIYNEYGFEFDDNVRRDAVLGLLRRLLAKGVPIHALGIQGHLRYTDLAKFQSNMTLFRTFLRDVAALGLKIIITEFDVDDSALPSGITARDEGIGKMYGEFCSVVMNEPAVIGFMTWGLSDKYTSLNATAPRSDRQQQRPLPLDSSMVRKSAWYALEFWFKNTTRRPTQTISDVRQNIRQGNSINAALSCFPNPANNVCTVELTLPVANEQVFVRLVDILGRDVLVIARESLPSGTHKFSANVALLPPGVYTCIAQSASFLASDAIIVQR